MVKNFTKTLIVTFAAVIFTSLFIQATTDNNGKAGYTGSPGETTCATTNCHNSYALNSGPGTLEITSDIPASGYVANATYAITVTITQPGVSIFGFDFEALQASNTSAGTLVVTNTTETQLRTANGKSNITHKKFTSSTIGIHEFKFNWTAPQQTTGDITFYVAANATNGDNKVTGDFIYSKSAKISPSNLTAISEKDFQLLSIYPNPINDDLKIDYSVESPGKVTIELLSTDGNVVQHLIDEYHYEGYFRRIIKIDAKVIPGIYFLKINTTKGVQGKTIFVN